MRARAVALRQEDRASTRAIVATLRHEHGADVPPSTVEGWLKAERRTAPPSDVPGAIENLTARMIVVLAREISMLERTRGRLDLARVERVTRSLSMLRRAPVRSGRSTENSKGRTLADLAPEAIDDASDVAS